MKTVFLLFDSLNRLMLEPYGSNYLKTPNPMMSQPTRSSFLMLVPVLEKMYRPVESNTIEPRARTALAF